MYHFEIHINYATIKKMRKHSNFLQKVILLEDVKINRELLGLNHRDKIISKQLKASVFLRDFCD
jgi:hypothetical protein